MSEELILDLASAIPLIPIATFFVLLTIALIEFLRADPQERTHQFFRPEIYSWVSVISMGIVWCMSVWIAVDYFFISDLSSEAISRGEIMAWADLGSNLSIHYGVLVDTLSVIMTVIVATLTWGVLIYSMAYMKHGEHYELGYPRYMATIHLFVAGMFLLSLASNWIVLFVGWELMGLTSFLLIGFWFGEGKNARAARKAFLYTKVGDVLLLIGFILLMHELVKYGGEYSFSFLAMRDILQHSATEMENWRLTLIILLIFGGVVGKSAQFPLFGWLPDAMAGPTTVSTLIHSATMVKAGVYLLLRVFWLLYRAESHHGEWHFVPISQEAATTIAWIGCISAFMAGTMAMVATDIKRILAFSTVSQLSYMVMGIGAGGLAAGLLHVISHATFKATLFLAAGSVHHAVHTYDLRKMGGLRHKMPWTWRASLAGALALAGFPLSSGFVSKDAILYAVWHSQVYGAKALYIFGYTTAILTAFYTMRWLYMIFMGEARDQEKYEHAKESDSPMVIVLVALTVLIAIESVLFSISLFGFELLGHHGFESYLTKHLSAAILGVEVEEAIEVGSLALGIGLSLVIALSGIYFAYLTYRKNPTPAEKWMNAGWYTFIAGWLTTNYRTDNVIFWTFWKIHDFVAAVPDWLDKTFIDGFLVDSLLRDRIALGGATAADWVDTNVIDRLLVDTVLRDGIGLGGASAADWFDFHIIDSIVNGCTAVSFAIGRALRRLQTGIVSNYAAYMVTGLVFLMAYAAYAI